MLNLWELKDWHFRMRQANDPAAAQSLPDLEQPENWESEAELDADELQSFPVYLPSPAEIRAACEEIQRGWTETERRQRLGITRSKESAYVPPRVRIEIPA